MPVPRNQIIKKQDTLYVFFNHIPYQYTYWNHGFHNTCIMYIVKDHPGEQWAVCSEG